MSPRSRKFSAFVSEPAFPKLNSPSLLVFPYEHCRTGSKEDAPHRDRRAPCSRWRIGTPRHSWNWGPERHRKPGVPMRNLPRRYPFVTLVIAALLITVLELFLRDSIGRPPQYTIVDLGTLGGDESAVNAINGLGEVVGTWTIESGDHHAFIWCNGTMKDLGTLGGKRATLTASTTRAE